MRARHATIAGAGLLAASFGLLATGPAALAGSDPLGTLLSSAAAIAPVSSSAAPATTTSSAPAPLAPLTSALNSLVAPVASPSPTSPTGSPTPVPTTSAPKLTTSGGGARTGSSGLPGTTLPRAGNPPAGASLPGSNQRGTGEVLGADLPAALAPGAFAAPGVVSALNPTPSLAGLLAGAAVPAPQTAPSGTPARVAVTAADNRSVAGPLSHGGLPDALVAIAVVLVAGAGAGNLRLAIRRVQ